MSGICLHGLCCKKEADLVKFPNKDTKLLKKLRVPYRHDISDADLINDEARSVGKNGHWLEVNQKTILLEKHI
jgi:hypothetical protein